MGLCAGKERPRRLVRGSLVDQILRVKLTAQQSQMRLERELKIKDDLLLEAFGGEPARRSKTIEKAMINRTVYTHNIKLSTPPPTQSTSTSSWKPSAYWMPSCSCKMKPPSQRSSRQPIPSSTARSSSMMTRCWTSQRWLWTSFPPIGCRGRRTSDWTW
jgi:hypothetical protein